MGVPISETDFYDDIGLAPTFKECYPYVIAAAQNAAVIVEFGCKYGDGITKALAWGLRRSKAENKLMVSVDNEDWISGGDRAPTEEWWHFLLGHTINKTVTYDVDDIETLEAQKTALIASITATKTAELSAVGKVADEKFEEEKAVLIAEALRTKEENLRTGVESMPRKEVTKQYISVENSIITLLKDRKIDIIWFGYSYTPEDILAELALYEKYCSENCIYLIVCSGNKEHLATFLSTLDAYSKNKELKIEQIHEFVTALHK